MPRAARRKSATGVYHVVVRGINRQNIFQTVDDKKRFLDNMFKYKKELRFILFAYCVMDNHVHFLIGENLKEIEKITLAGVNEINRHFNESSNLPPVPPTIDLIIKKICSSYAGYYNLRYNRIGHLFQDSYRACEPSLCQSVENFITFGCKFSQMCYHNI